MVFLRDALMKGHALRLRHEVIRLVCQVIDLCESVLMLEHLVHDVEEGVRLLGRGRLPHEVDTLLEHAGVRHTVVHELAEPLGDDPAGVGVVGHLLDGLALKELAHGDDALHELAALDWLHPGYQLLDPEVLLTDVVLNEHAAVRGDRSLVGFLVLLHHDVVLALHAAFVLPKVLVLPLYGVHGLFDLQGQMTYLLRLSLACVGSLDVQAVRLALIEWSDQITQEVNDLVLVDEGDDRLENSHEILVENHPQREA